MAYRLFNNKKYGTVCILFTANDSLTITGNTTTSNVAVSDESLAGGVITKIWGGSPSGNAAYWKIMRGGNTVFVLDTTQTIDFSGHGTSLNLDYDQTLVANLVGATVGTLIIQVKKVPAANGFPTLGT